MADTVSQTGPKEYDRACILVGRFMYNWALLENALNTGVGKLLGMGNIESAIATANMQARAKIHIIKTLVDLKGGGATWAKKAGKDMDAVSALSAIRNTIAHVVFGPDESGGVRFLTVRAKGKLSFPDTILSEGDFRKYYGEARRLGDEVKAIVERLSKGRGLGAFIAALGEPASLTPPEQESPSPLARLLLGDRGSPPATSETAPETPQEPPK